MIFHERIRLIGQLACLSSLKMKGIFMTKASPIFSLLAIASLFLTPLAVHAVPKTYQVTGPVLELTDTTIVVQKGTERWEIARDASTKVKGELAVGKKVTIEYRMAATSVEVKADKAEKLNDVGLQ